MGPQPAVDSGTARPHMNSSMPDQSLVTPNTGIRLNYRDWGGNGSPLVLAHGLASTLHIWDLVAPLLTGRFRVIAYDQRGHAQSGKPATGYDLATMVADLHGLVSALGLVKPVVVGHSWGATLALGFAGRYPDNCAGIALVDGGLTDMASRPGATWLKIREELAPPDLSRYTLEDLVAWMLDQGLPLITEEFARTYFGAMMNVQPNGTVRARLTRDNHLKILRTMWDTRPEELYRRVKCPLLMVVAGGRGEPAERETAFIEAKKRGMRRVEELLPEARGVWMQDTIHDIPLQRPQELAKEILDYFAPANGV